MNKSLEINIIFENDNTVDLYYNKATKEWSAGYNFIDANDEEIKTIRDIFCQLLFYLNDECKYGYIGEYKIKKIIRNYVLLFSNYKCIIEIMDTSNYILTNN